MNELEKVAERILPFLLSLRDMHSCDVQVESVIAEKEQTTGGLDGFEGSNHTFDRN